MIAKTDTVTNRIQRQTAWKATTRQWSFQRGTDKGDRRCLSVLCHCTCTIHTITQDLKLDFILKIYIRSSTTHKQCIMRTHGGCVLYGWSMKLSIWGFIITVHAFDKRLVHNKTLYIFNKQNMSHVLHIFEREKRKFIAILITS